MVPQLLQEKVRQVVIDSVALIAPHFPDEVFPSITAQFERSYRNAGWADTGNHIVNFDPILLVANEDEFLRQIVPHEVAHVVTDHIYGFDTEHHGKEWKSIMILMGLPPDAFHELDISISKRQMTTYEFSCACDNGTYVHEYGSVMRRKILSEKLQCTACWTYLRAIEPIHVPPRMPYEVAIGTKQDRAKWVIAKNKGLRRKDLIQKLVDDAGLTKAGASTYIYNLQRNC